MINNNTCGYACTDKANQIMFLGACHLAPGLSKRYSSMESIKLLNEALVFHVVERLLSISLPLA